MIEVKQGNCIEVLKEMEQNSIDTIYTCPSPFQYYKEDDVNILGTEVRLDKYLFHLDSILRACHGVLKDSGSLFLQIPEQFNRLGGLLGIPTIVENHIRNLGVFYLFNRLFWHRTETRKLKYKERGFLKNYEYIFHLVKDPEKFYFNENSKYAKTSVHSYPLEDSYYTNEFDSGLPYQLSEMVIDTTCPPNGTVLDPLCGSGKVGVVAKRMNRNFIGIDINLDTVEACRIRLSV